MMQMKCQLVDKQYANFPHKNLKAKGLCNTPLINTRDQVHELNTNNKKNKQDILSLLIIENNPILQYGYLSLFEKLSCLISMASTGSEAIQKIKHNTIQRPFSLILLSIELPDISGIQLCQVIRQLDTVNQHHTPIVIVSAYAEDKRHECLAAGCDQVIGKLKDAADLLKLLQPWLLLE